MWRRAGSTHQRFREASDSTRQSTQAPTRISLSFESSDGWDELRPLDLARLRKIAAPRGVGVTVLTLCLQQLSPSR